MPSSCLLHLGFDDKVIIYGVIVWLYFYFGWFWLLLSYPTELWVLCVTAFALLAVSEELPKDLILVMYFSSICCFIGRQYFKFFKEEMFYLI